MLFTYFFRAGDHVKIGASINPRARATQLRRAARALFGLDCPIADMLLVIPASVASEDEVHTQFAHLREWRIADQYHGAPSEIGGQCEWFQATPALTDYIASLDPHAIPRDRWPTRPRHVSTTPPTAQTHAQRLGRLGGLARGRSMTPAARSTAARRAVQYRWHQAKA